MVGLHSSASLFTQIYSAIFFLSVFTIHKHLLYKMPYELKHVNQSLNWKEAASIFTIFGGEPKKALFIHTYFPLVSALNYRQALVDYIRYYTSTMRPHPGSQNNWFIWSMVGHLQLKICLKKSTWRSIVAYPSQSGNLPLSESHLILALGCYPYTRRDKYVLWSISGWTSSNSSLVVSAPLMYHLFWHPGLGRIVEAQ